MSKATIVIIMISMGQLLSIQVLNGIEDTSEVPAAFEYYESDVISLRVHYNKMDRVYDYRIRNLSQNQWLIVGSRVSVVKDTAGYSLHLEGACGNVSDMVALPWYRQIAPSSSISGHVAVASKKNYIHSYQNNRNANYACLSYWQESHPVEGMDNDKSKQLSQVKSVVYVSPIAFKVGE